MSNKNFKTLESLDPLKNVLNEAIEALKDSKRTITQSNIPDVLGAAVGAGLGGVISFSTLYGLGTAGLSAVGITSGLATTGAIVGGGMVAGVFVLTAPVAILAAGGFGIVRGMKAKKLKQIKVALLQEVIRKHDATIRELNNGLEKSEERIKYLDCLIVLLSRAMGDLSEDLAS